MMTVFFDKDLSPGAPSTDALCHKNRARMIVIPGFVMVLQDSRPPIVRPSVEKWGNEELD